LDAKCKLHRFRKKKYYWTSLITADSLFASLYVICCKIIFVISVYCPIYVFSMFNCMHTVCRNWILILFS
jgi:hypothetical protein